jgi:hypothetical protein
MNLEVNSVFHQAETGVSWELCRYIEIAVQKVQGSILHKAMTMDTMILWGRGVNGGGCIGVSAGMVLKVKHIKHLVHYTDGLATSPKLMWWGHGCIMHKVIGIGNQTGCVSGLSWGRVTTNQSASMRKVLHWWGTLGGAVIRLFTSILGLELFAPGRWSGHSDDITWHRLYCILC